MGFVEDKFEKAARKAKKTPAKYMAGLRDTGVTQKALADKLGCTRQAIGRLADKLGVPFPGCAINIDAVARVVWGIPFAAAITDYPEERYVDMAEELGVSLSTFKRRVKELGLCRRDIA